MSIYVERFAHNLEGLKHKLDYFNNLSVNLLHLMPLMESPPLESDGGYAVSNFRNVNPAYGTIDELISLQKNMQKKAFISSSILC